MNFFGGPCQTRVPGETRRVFLTFDDGPHPGSTPALLELLARHKTPATFFLVAARAQREPKLARAIPSAGHAVGNHSLEHSYAPFFRGAAQLATWIQSAQAELKQATGATPLAFRSPAGVRTPELRRALALLGLAHVQWSRRYFDAVIPFHERKAKRAASAARAGDIILLHDIPRRDPARFHAALAALITGLRAHGLEPSALRPGDIQP